MPRYTARRRAALSSARARVVTDSVERVTGDMFNAVVFPSICHASATLMMLMPRRLMPRFAADIVTD